MRMYIVYPYGPVASGRLGAVATARMISSAGAGSESTVAPQLIPPATVNHDGLLAGTSFRHANLYQAKLDGAVFRNTVMPDGTVTDRQP